MVYNSDEIKSTLSTIVTSENRVNYDQENRPIDGTSLTKLNKTPTEQRRLPLTTRCLNLPGEFPVPNTTTVTTVKSLSTNAISTTTSGNSHQTKAKAPQTSRGEHSTVRVSRRNERERNRVRLINLGFERLRAVVPCQSGEQLSKISTLRKAIWYIEHLDRVLHGSSSSADENTSGRVTGTLNNMAVSGDQSGLRATPACPQNHMKPLRIESMQPGKPPPPPPPLPPSTIPLHISQCHYPTSSCEMQNRSTGSRQSTQRAVRMASWSHPDTPREPHGTIGTRGRSVLVSAASTVQAALPHSSPQLLSPIFPTQWVRGGAELASTPKPSALSHTWAKHVMIDSSEHDSGYVTLNRTGTRNSNDQGLATRNWYPSLTETSQRMDWNSSFACPTGTGIPYTSWWTNMDT